MFMCMCGKALRASNLRLSGDNACHLAKGINAIVFLPRDVHYNALSNPINNNTAFNLVHMLRQLHNK